MKSQIKETYGNTNNYPPLTGTSLILPANVLVNGHTYRWNMTSFNGSTEILVASSVLYFQTPPAVVSAPIIAPPNSGSLAGIVQPAQPVVSTSSTTPTMLPPAAGQPDFSSVYYMADNIFYQSGNAPNASASAKANATGGAFSLVALGNCTWYAYGRMLELGANSAQLKRAVYGNAGDWASEAQSVFTVGKIPAVHSIAQLNSKVGFSHGHVAIVESKNADGTITVSESMYSTNPDYNIQWRLHTYSPSWFDNYIYVFNLPNSSSPTMASSTSSGVGIVGGVANSTVISPQNSASAVAPNQTPNSPVLQSVAAKSIVTTTPQSATLATLMLSALPNNEGIVIGGGNYVSGSSRTVTAIPKSSFIFENWTENGRVVSSSANYNFTMNGNRNLAAHFRPNFMNRPATPNSSPNNQNQNPWSIKTSTPNLAHGTNQFRH